MARLFQYTLLGLCLSSLLSIQMMAANHCPRCVKIESERAAQGPQPVKYYDDQIGLNDSNTQNTQSALNTQNIQNQNRGSESTTQQSPYYDERDTMRKESNAINSPNRVYIQDQQGGSREQDYSTILVILQSRDFLNTLNGPFTFFIPANGAFRKVPPGTLQSLFYPANREQLSDLVGNHLVAQKIAGSDIKNMRIKTVNGKNLDIKVENGVVKVNGARILRSENVGDDGVVYIIDNVLQ